MRKPTRLSPSGAIALLALLCLGGSAPPARADGVPAELKPSAALDLKGCVELLATSPTTFQRSGWWRKNNTTISFNKTTKTLHLTSLWTRDYWDTNLDMTLDFGNQELRLDKSSMGSFVMHCDRADTVDHCAYNLKDNFLDSIETAEKEGLSAGDAHGASVLDCTKRLASQFMLEARTRLARPFGDEKVSADAPPKGATPTSGLEQEPARRKPFVVIPH